MFLFVAGVAVTLIVMTLCLITLAIGINRLQETVRLGFDLLDLVKLLVILRLKAARVRSVDW